MSGTGSGVVISTQAGILCGTTCSATYGSGTAVTLTATTTVTATFNQQTQTQTQTLTVGTSGKGTVTSMQAGITCGKICSASYPSGTTVTLTATPGAGFAFSSWGGACAGTANASCAVSMTAAKSVTATFRNMPGEALNARRLTRVWPGSRRMVMATS